MQQVSKILSNRRLKWVWLAAGLALGIGLSVPAAKDLTVNDATAFLPTSAQSTKVVAELKKLPGGDRSSAIVVYERSGGKLTAKDTAAITADAGKLAKIKGAGPVTPTQVSADGHSALVSVTFPSVPAPADGVKAARDVAGAGLPAGLQAKVTGPAGFLVDQLAAFDGLNGKLLGASIVVVAIILLLTYRSPWLWLVPLFVVGMADQAAGGIVNLLAEHAGWTLNGENTGILRVLVFGAGTDYALLLIARYREELHRHEDRYEAMAAALRAASPAILASGFTVILGLLALVVCTLNSDRTLGPVAAVGIACALVFGLVMLPAMLLLFGRGLFWPRVPKFGDERNTESSMFATIGRAINRHPVWLGGLCTLLLVGLSLSLPKIHLGLPVNEAIRGTNQSIEGQAMIARHFPAGSTAPLIVISNTGEAKAAAAKIQTDSHVVAAVPGSSNAARSELTVITTDVPDSDAAFDTIRRLRDDVATVSEAGALVGGETAATLDTNDAAEHDRWVAMPAILGIVLIMLIILLRSLAAPIWLVISVVLSYAAALAYSNVLYSWVLGFSVVDQTVPLLGFVFLVALGVDYNIFLMTRAAEETPKLGLRGGTTHALVTTGGVITSAGIVLAATFAVLAVLPLTIMTQIGVLVSVGVLLDTIFVRTVIVPSLAIGLRRGFWWPRFRNMRSK